MKRLTLIVLGLMSVIIITGCNKKTFLFPNAKGQIIDQKTGKPVSKMTAYGRVIYILPPDKDGNVWHLDTKHPRVHIARRYIDGKVVETIDWPVLSGQYAAWLSQLGMGWVGGYNAFFDRYPNKRRAQFYDDDE